MNIRIALLVCLFGLIGSGSAGEPLIPLQYCLKAAVLKKVAPFSSCGSATDYRNEYLMCGEEQLLLVTLEDVAKQNSSFQFFVLPCEASSLASCRKFEVYVMYTETADDPTVRIVGRGKHGKVDFELTLRAALLTIIRAEAEKTPRPRLPQDQGFYNSSFS